MIRSKLPAWCFAFAALSLCSCADTSSTVTTTTTTTTRKEPLMTMAAARAEFVPLQTPAPDVRLINEAGAILPGTNKAYAVGRYRDPGNSRILHEPHVIIRHEEDPSFIMTAGRDNEVVVGSTASGAGRRYTMIRPPLHRSELEAALSRQQADSAQLRQQSEALKANSTALKEAAEHFNQASGTQTAALQQVGTLRNSVDDLSGRVSRLESAPTPPPLPVATPAPASTRARPGQPQSTPYIAPDGTIR